MTDEDVDGGAAGRGAWRLTFEYEGDTVRLVDRRRVQMLAPPDDSALVQQGQDGYWIEVRDDDDQPLYRQVLNRPVQTEFEVHSPDPGVRPRHVPATEVRGVFQAVVPDLPNGATVAVQGAEAAPAPDSRERDAGEDDKPGAATDAAPPQTPAQRTTARTLVVASLAADEGPKRSRDGRR